MKKRLFKKKNNLKKATRQESGVFKFTGKLKSIKERIHKKTTDLVTSLKKDSKTVTQL